MLDVNTAKILAVIITFLKLEHTFIAAKAGKTTSAVISNEPTRFIASTITKASGINVNLYNTMIAVI